MSTNPTESSTRSEDSAVQSGSPVATGETGHCELFCDRGGLYVPDGEQWACQNCQQTRADLSGEFTLQTPREPRELDIVSERFFLGPKTSETCPVCEHGEAYYKLRQTRSADESETRFFTCASCEHEWREND